MLDKNTILDFLEEKNIKYESVDHEVVYTIYELLENKLPHVETLAKNLLVRDDKKANYYLIVCHEDKQFRVKDFQHAHGLRHLSFASEDDLMAKMGLRRGAVTPLGILNNEEKDIKVYIDSDYEGQMIGVPACCNDRTVFLETNDVVKLLTEHGNVVEFTEI